MLGQGHGVPQLPELEVGLATVHSSIQTYGCLARIAFQRLPTPDWNMF
jgi:hypothetical protein